MSFEFPPKNRLIVGIVGTLALASCGQSSAEKQAQARADREHQANIAKLEHKIQSPSRDHTKQQLGIICADQQAKVFVIEQDVSKQQKHWVSPLEKIEGDQGKLKVLCATETSADAPIGIVKESVVSQHYNAVAEINLESYEHETPSGPDKKVTSVRYKEGEPAKALQLEYENITNMSVHLQY